MHSVLSTQSARPMGFLVFKFSYFYKKQHSSSLFSAECIFLLHPGFDASFSLQVTLKSYGSKSSYPEAIKELFLSYYFFSFWSAGCQVVPGH